MRTKEIKTLIINEAAKQFFKFGIQSVSVDDICYAISISKKTFYEHFANKSELVEQIANDFLQKTQKITDDIMKKEDVIDKMLLLYSSLLKQFKNCNAAFIYDIKKYYPDIFKVFDQYKDNALKNLLISLINEGKREGVFIEDFDAEIIFTMHWKRFNNIIERELLPQKNLYDPIYIQMMKVSLIGISTLKGHQLIEEKFNTLN